MDESLCCPPETITTLLIGYIPVQNKKYNKLKKKEIVEARNSEILFIKCFENKTENYQPRIV